ncbi:phage protein NinX family protein [Providencia sp. SP181]|uniref:phage protein NinX family protein n=1 Tax=Providencia sp. SP181 TaxID=3136277 RepID=UPI003D2B42BA
MNKYTELSDFEINKKVAERLFLKFSDCYSVILVDGESFDPCNNPADAMVIIIDYGISLIFDTGCKAWVAGIAYWVDGCEWQISYEVERMNQYRAAMELFLLMKDAENNNETSSSNDDASIN